MTEVKTKAKPRKATAKKTTPKKTVTKPVSENVVESDTVIEPKTVVEPEVKAAKKYEANTLISCKSVVSGDLTYRSKKTGMTYVWVDMEDSCLVEYQDILMLLMSREKYLYAPWIVIEDEELLKERRWQEIATKTKEFTDIGNMEQYILTVSPDELKNTLTTCSTALKTAIVSKAFQLINRNKLDSIGTLSAIKDATGTDLRLFG